MAAKWFNSLDTNALSFYRSQNVLCWSKFFEQAQKFIYILCQSQTFCARQKDDLHSVKLVSKYPFYLQIEIAFVVLWGPSVILFQIFICTCTSTLQFQMLKKIVKVQWSISILLKNRQVKAWYYRIDLI